MDNEEIIIIYKEVGKPPIFRKEPNNRETFELLVGGEIEILPYEEIFIICRKDRERLRPNIGININYGKADFSIRGNIIIVNKEFKSLHKEQAIKYSKLLIRESFNYKSFDENGKYLSNRALKRRKKQQKKNTESNIADDITNVYRRNVKENR